VSYRLTPAARGDVAGIVTPIAGDDPRAAKRWLASLRATRRRISTHPGLGTDRSAILPRLRMFPAGAYLILCRVEGRQAAEGQHAHHDHVPEHHRPRVRRDRRSGIGS
jgi:plasmid stabilization system protein ParE